MYVLTSWNDSPKSDNSVSLYSLLLEHFRGANDHANNRRVGGHCRSCTLTNPRGATSALWTSWIGIEYLMDGRMGCWWGNELMGGMRVIKTLTRLAKDSLMVVRKQWKNDEAPCKFYFDTKISPSVIHIGNMTGNGIEFQTRLKSRIESRDRISPSKENSVQNRRPRRPRSWMKAYSPMANGPGLWSAESELLALIKQKLPHSQQNFAHPILTPRKGYGCASMMFGLILSIYGAVTVNRRPIPRHDIHNHRFTAESWATTRRAVHRGAGNNVGAVTFKTTTSKRDLCFVTVPAGTLWHSDPSTRTCELG
ncbi:hypothetical protein EVAR_102827_1 [Eumeta japonica]|uniref:Uncharacterized protein n=1 Tax=Eumeta variegata TaxID=151549 RepID=A0A4C2A391_EUMVA|nr:hypothetical protein EVAR_102827_1 [Eumeta japonica]